jgi:hypothetical protein
MARFSKNIAYRLAPMRVSHIFGKPSSALTAGAFYFSLSKIAALFKLTTS